MNSNEETIVFTTEDNETVEFSVIADTKLNGINYLLVIEDESDEETYIMKEVQLGESEVIYEMVEDEIELRAVADVFEELLEDITIE